MPQYKTSDDDESDEPPVKEGCRYWLWAELMARTFEVDVKKCPRCSDRTQAPEKRTIGF